MLINEVLRKWSGIQIMHLPNNFTPFSALNYPFSLAIHSKYIVQCANNELSDTQVWKLFV